MARSSFAWLLQIVSPPQKKTPKQIPFPLITLIQSHKKNMNARLPYEAPNLYCVVSHQHLWCPEKTFLPHLSSLDHSQCLREKERERNDDLKPVAVTAVVTCVFNSLSFCCQPKLFRSGRLLGRALRLPSKASS